MMTIETKKRIVLVAGAALSTLLVLAAAQRPIRAQASDDTVRFKITAGGTDLYKLAVPLALGDKASAKTAQDVLSNDLALSGFFKVIDPASYLANLAAEQLTINPADWRNVGAAGVIKARATGYGADVKFEFRLFEVSKGDAPVLSKDYRGAMLQARQLAHQFANDVVKYYTGEEGFFSSKIAFAGDTGPKRRDIMTMDWDGYGASALTSKSQNILPSWSPSGAEIAFTSFAGGKPDLYVVPALGGKPRILSAQPGLNMGAAYSPDGSKIALTLSKDGNSEIYLLNTNGQVIKRLTNETHAIDTSPTFSPDGSRIAFISDRHGNPQIWVMSADGSGQKKLTRKGNYNQTPTWSPNKDTPLIAFTARDERMAYDIFTINPDTEQYGARITEGHGSNQHPSWAPNGRAITYESSRGGVWISTADGRTERQVYRGSALAPQWSPSLRR
ncbi:MAG: domain protein beta Propeller [Myxococcales bacterium]|nr:domain protein beta Propeller [Myxococcales bacterium]